MGDIENQRKVTFQEVDQEDDEYDQYDQDPRK